MRQLLITGTSARGSWATGTITVDTGLTAVLVPADHPSTLCQLGAADGGSALAFGLARELATPGQPCACW